MDQEDKRHWETKKDSIVRAINAYRRLVPGKLSKLLPITINEWRNTVEQLGQNGDVTSHLKQNLIDGVSLRICLYWFISEKSNVYSFAQHINLTYCNCSTF